MLLAELEIRHSRPYAPTRRVALGRLWLPADPPPGHGGLLLAGILAAGVSALDDDDLLERICVLLEDLDGGRRVVQPRVLFRFQSDTHGLDRSVHRLVEDAAGAPVLEIDGHGAVLPQVLGALYAASKLSSKVRGEVFRLLRRATRWTGAADESLVRFLAGDEAATLRRGLLRDERWALRILGFDDRAEPDRAAIQRRFRELVRDAHPDQGGEVEGAGLRILELSEARRVLLGGSP